MTPANEMPTYAFSTTRESIDQAPDAFQKVKELTVKLSMVENAAYRLATNIKKTQKRANALQNITIPMYTQLVYNDYQCAGREGAGRVYETESHQTNEKQIIFLKKS